MRGDCPLEVLRTVPVPRPFAMVTGQLADFCHAAAALPSVLGLGFRESAVRAELSARTAAETTPRTGP